MSSQRDYFRRNQDEILSTPIEVARRLPDDILRIAGYCMLQPLTIATYCAITSARSKANAVPGYQTKRLAELDT